MLLTKTLSEFLFSNGHITAVIESSDPISDFNLTAYDKIGIMTESDDLLIFVDADVCNETVSVCAQSQFEKYEYELTEEENEKIFKEVLQSVI